ncbi:hypothetical protein H7K45_01470 [Mycobacterium yunnanensis]|uniref:Uncharacterized protein n=1 Tax=Mycobacterium yunnanensis TaxID=368477 RepID=A0A9X2YX33_9MYCO|nr:hypothetical protein [Mycobacterium yunnanensis]MCV7419199.1 hypothetical protein [Mycobacterium yunnanensis]
MFESAVGFTVTVGFEGAGADGVTVGSLAGTSTTGSDVGVGAGVSVGVGVDDGSVAVLAPVFVCAVTVLDGASPSVVSRVPVSVPSAEVSAAVTLGGSTFAGAVAAPAASEALDSWEEALVDPVEPSPMSASAVVGNTTTVPTPRTTANAPTRPT